MNMIEEDKGDGRMFFLSSPFLISPSISCAIAAK
jgi:hypothetical protein